MKTLYLETSPLLAWLFGENKAEQVARNLKKVDLICTSALTLIEAKRNLIRQERLGRITAAQRQKSLGLVEQISSPWIIMEINSTVQKRSAETFPIEPVRSLDAIHLASALQFVEVYPELEFFTFDERILSNLGPLGLTTHL